ncbi:dehydratase [Halorarum halophilum]|uniref:Dehydratase n=1 Tax=Halorarum halophilum TaxID=2743090 RepID=A0A7D5GG90_9EURY|nr:hotdog domain-containing protein [Halobaculum halophilum]QLG26611.1 dehydratase [Halobaculum halophilum]
MNPADLPEEGTVVRHERTFTREEVREFADLSGDRGTHHEERDEQGRLLVHGLLTATLPTKIGGDLDVLAREMTFEFRRPVHTGERIVCEVTVADVEHGDGRADVTAPFVCHNGDGELVLSGSFDGVVFA